MLLFSRYSQTGGHTHLHKNCSLSGSIYSSLRCALIFSRDRSIASNFCNPPDPIPFGCRGDLEGIVFPLVFLYRKNMLMYIVMSNRGGKRRWVFSVSCASQKGVAMQNPSASSNQKPVFDLCSMRWPPKEGSWTWGCTRPLLVISVPVYRSV